MYIKGRRGILQKIAFEVRYQYGFTYLDKCGKTVNTIMRHYPEWIIKGDTPNPQDGRLVSMRNGCSFSFSPYSYNFGLEMPSGGEPLNDADVSSFADQADLLSRVVNDCLALEVFSRIGLRTWYLFSFEAVTEATNWLSSLGYYSVSPKLTLSFESSLDAATVVMLLTGTERKFRLSFSSVERQAQLDLGEEILSVRASRLSKDQDKFLLRQLETKRRIHSNPEYAALIDIDSFQENPVSVDSRDFIQTSMTQYLQRLERED